ncbi:ubiquitin carboxyl-terminal hydrolase 22/27/51 [Pancytospora epiphaga]|nr:ubiquitin carboxyl-terminal hydrolase 22/27/51 [Pancytospora epiphaga]
MCVRKRCDHYMIVDNRQKEILNIREVVMEREAMGTGMECMVCKSVTELYISCECGMVLCEDHILDVCGDFFSHEHYLYYKIGSSLLLCTLCWNYVDLRDIRWERSIEGRSRLLNTILLKRYKDSNHISYLGVILKIMFNSAEVMDHFLSFHHPISSCFIVNCPDCFFKRLYSQIFSKDPVDLTYTVCHIYRRTQHHIGFKARNLIHLYNLICNLYHPNGIAPENCKCIMHKMAFGSLEALEECTVCHVEKKSIEEFDVMSLRMHYSLTVALQEYLIDHVSGIPTECSTCGQATPTRIKRTIKVYPTLLGMYINRFVDHAECRKNNSRIRIEEEMIIQERKYDLYAFVEHRGSHRGCFVCYILLKGVWYEFNREKVVRDVNANFRISHAIMVFYKLSDEEVL